LLPWAAIFHEEPHGIGERRHRVARYTPVTRVRVRYKIGDFSKYRLTSGIGAKLYEQGVNIVSVESSAFDAAN
jgi:hypothetical protein